jgi:hypothetical protein
MRGYAFYLRVADLPGFIRHVAPVLEQRLADSSAAGYSGDLQISFYRGGLVLRFDSGRLTSAEHFDPPQQLDAGASFPGLTFLHVLFGWRSRQEVESLFPDCFTRGEAPAVLLDVLFPKQPSHVWPIQ